MNIKINDDQNILCPICQDEYVHIAEEPKITSESSSPNCRGNVIRLEGFCEQGHNFQICIGFHKGYTPVWCEAR